MTEDQIRYHLEEHSAHHLGLHSRRQFIAGVGGATFAAMFLAACGGEDGETTTLTASTTTAAGVTTPKATNAATGAATDLVGAATWEYTDGRGRTLSLPKRPERIVMYSNTAAALWELGVRPIAIWGPQRMEDGAPNPLIGNVDLDAVESVGEDDSEIDLERLAALEPDLVVGFTVDGETLWPISEEDVPQLTEIAPTVGILRNGVTAKELIQDLEELAVALGADREAPEVAESRDRFLEAEAELQAAVADKPGLSVIALSLAEQEVWIARPDLIPELSYFRALGLGIIPHEQELSSSDFSPKLSWEQLGNYATDLILLDARPRWLQAAEASGKPTWDLLPAVAAGQLGAWSPERVYNYAGVQPGHRILHRTRPQYSR